MTLSALNVPRIRHDVEMSHHDATLVKAGVSRAENEESFHPARYEASPLLAEILFHQIVLGLDNR